jgi:hypothetical protein
MRKTVFFVFCICALASNALVAEESLTITTYYPSPYGVYNELSTNTLVLPEQGTGVPDVSDCNALAEKGRIRVYNSQLYYCNGSAWTAIGGGGAAGYWSPNGTNIYNTNTGNVDISGSSASRGLRFGNSHDVQLFRNDAVLISGVAPVRLETDGRFFANRLRATVNGDDGDVAVQLNDGNTGLTSNGTSEIYLVANGSKVVYVEEGGVGIKGQRQNDYAFSVNGHAYKSDGDAGWNFTSDARLKKNIKPLTGSLDKLTKLKGMTYEWKDPQEHGNSFGEQIGFIGQQVAGVFPQWVRSDNEGYMVLSMGGLDAVIVESIKELKAENDMLKQRLAELEKKLNVKEAGTAPVKITR